MNVFRTDREVHSPDDPLVNAGQSERPAALNVLARKNLHARDMRLDGRSQEDEQRNGPDQVSA